MEYVDLGLPSGKKWAKCNLGASSEEESGLYFQWGDIQGYTAEQVWTDKQFDWDDYKLANNTSLFKLTKYNSTDNKVQLDLEDDAVYVALGSNWRMPTKDDFHELIDNTTREVTLINDIQGMKFTSNVNSNYIFFPFSGFAFESFMHFVGSYFYCWSSSLESVNETNALYLYGDSKSDICLYYDNRRYGLSIRGIYVGG